MSDTPISEREFLRFEGNLEKAFQRQDKILELMTTSITGIESTLGKLTEYQIHNDSKHDKTTEEIKVLTEKDVNTNLRIDKTNAAVVANTRVSSFWRTFGKNSTKIIIGITITVGAAVIIYMVIG